MTPNAPGLAAIFANAAFPRAWPNCACALFLASVAEIPAVRRTVYRLGYHIADERCAVASRRFYIMITAKPGQEKISEEETELGPCLYRHRDDPAVREYYLWRHKVLSVERNETSEKKARWYFEAL